MWDLAISPAGDLIWSGNNDLSGISGTDLIDQRISLRLRLHRGSWTYDDNDSLGSQLYRLLGQPPNAIASAALAYVNEALHEIEEIAVDNVRVVPGVRSASVIVDYHVLDDIGAVGDQTAEQVEIQVPVGGSF